MWSQLVIRGPGPSCGAGTLLASPGGLTWDGATRPGGAGVCWPRSDLALGGGKLHSCALFLSTAAAGARAGGEKA